jgi:hypothetical protein
MGALGAARTGAYYAVAPLFGVALSLAPWPSAPGPAFWIAAAPMATGVGLHPGHLPDLHHRHGHAGPAPASGEPHAT